MERLVDGQLHETQGCPPDVLFKHQEPHRLSLIYEVVGQFPDHGRLADTRACREGHKLPLADTTGLLVQALPRVREGLRVVLSGDLFPQLVTSKDAIGSMDLGSPDGVDDLPRLSSLEGLIGILEAVDPCDL